ncbi:NAD(P)/FAD-dependent oxidoreductase [Lolliginicoccus suaedae]|uniref:NAD(P)/FAD-dependent oxidoreductase n=1 Tax=Lolliginicoccus suaedae TaxID=2605429 RepID=UPI0011ECF8A0|nr:NAD(P)/FAD-dependent oxidoreductase [Lolliginicoccus suaedae]
MSNPSLSPTVDALVIGAGPAGLGTALALQAVDGITYGVLEQATIGHTFEQWPAAMNLLTPSFTGNAFGAIDLNAIHPRTSPALLLQTDYPSGEEYAHYLRKITEHYEVPVVEHTAVEQVTPTDDEQFQVTTARGVLTARTVVWAGGEFARPAIAAIPGADLAIHSSDPKAWDPPEHDPVIVIGGYESGIDIACTLASRGHQVTVLDPETPWERASSDPSVTLSPRSQARLREARATGRLHLRGEVSASSVEARGGHYVVTASDGTTLSSAARPVLATGYRPHLGPVEHLFDSRADGWPALTGNDESTITPGLFLAGPAVRHARLHLCFVYKFRQRFAHVAHTVGSRLGMDTSALKAWKTSGMWVEDVSCCDTSCVC